jgi:hypothetical protein
MFKVSTALFIFAAAASASNMAMAAPAHDPALICNDLDGHDGLVENSWADADATKPRIAEFFFSGPAKNLPMLDAGLRGLGFSVHPTRASSGRVATISTVINAAWLHEMMPKVCKLSTRARVDYDGWDIASEVSAQ